MRTLRFTATAAVLLVAGSAPGQLGPLFGGAELPPRPSAELDSALPRGRLRATQARPEGEGSRACSFRYPLCVQPARSERALAWLEALEMAYERIVLTLGAPAPLSDFRRGGGPELDLYLAAGTAPLRVSGDGSPAVGRESDSGWCLVGERQPTVARLATLCLGEVIAHRMDSAETAAARGALAEHLWMSTGSPTSQDVELVDDAQRWPDRPLLSGDDAATTSLLYAHLDRRSSGAVVPLAVHALAGGTSGGDPKRFDNEPDVWDVLRATYGPKPTSVGAAVVAFSLERALLGRAPEAVEAGGLAIAFPARVAFDWSVPLSSLPRRLITDRPLAPLGSTYTWVDLDEPTDGTTLALRAEWEGPVAFAWTLVTVAADGRLIARFDAPYVERSRSADRTVVDLAGARGVIVIGTNLGDVSPTYPYDPDFRPHEPHAATVYLAKL